MLGSRALGPTCKQVLGYGKVMRGMVGVYVPQLSGFADKANSI